jgi:hypothetical protein
MQLFENFLSKEQEDSIEMAMLKLPWYFNTIENDLNDISDSTPVYFVNLIGCESHGTTADDIKPFVVLLKKLEELTGREYMSRICRVKANLYTRRPDFAEGHYHKPHLDFYNNDTKLGDEGEIFLYYANDSDGDTVFFEEKRIDAENPTIIKRSPHKKGTALLFDNRTLHASSNPRVSEYRVNINFVFKK